MKLSDEEAIMWGTMMYLAGANASEGGDAATLRHVTAEDTGRAKALVAKEFESFKTNAKRERRRIN